MDLLSAGPPERRQGWGVHTRRDGCGDGQGFVNGRRVLERLVAVRDSSRVRAGWW
ncbi:MAG: hypothetical protein OXI56_09510 [bacterium]|nr:hypothetical protein [bacterium]